MPVGRFDSDMSTELVKITGISRRVRLFHRLRQNTQPSMTGIIRSSRMNAGAVGNAARSLQRFQPVPGADGREPGIIEKLAEGFPDRVIVVDHENQRTFRFRQRGRFGAFGVTHDAPSASSPAIDTATERLSWMRLGDDIP